MRTFMILMKCIPHLVDAAVELKSGKLMWCITINDFSCSDDESFFRKDSGSSSRRRRSRIRRRICSY